MTEITLHGELGAKIGKIWNLKISSVGEAMSAINILSKRCFFQYLLEKDKVGIKYQVLINGLPAASEKPLDNYDVNIEDIKSSELLINSPKIKTIDIVPILQGSDEGIIGVVLGVILIIVGVIISVVSYGALSGVGGALIGAGVGLLAGGIISLLSSPPKFDDFREFTSGGLASYLFSGPQNTTREGGPVPLGYGRLIVGSQVIQASFDIQDIDATQALPPKSQQEISEFE